MRARANEAATLISIALIDGAYYFAIPSLPDYLGELGVRDPSRIALHTGLLMGVPPVLAFLTGPAWGRIGDHTGLRVMALRTTLALAVIYFASALVSGAGQLLAVRILLGLIGGYQTLVVALATQGMAAERAGRAIARVQIVQTVVAALSPALGGVYAHLLSIRGMFFTASAMCAGAVLAFLLFYRDIERRRAGPFRLRSAFELRPMPGVGLLALLLLFAAAVERSFQPASTLFAAAQASVPGRSTHIAGLLLSVGAVGDGVAAWFAARLAGRRNLTGILRLRAAAGAAVTLALLHAAGVPAFLALRAVYSAAAGGMQTLLYIMASRLIPEEQRSSQFALLSSCVLLASGGGSLLTGVLSRWRVTGIFLLDAGLCAALALLARSATRPCGPDAPAADRNRPPRQPAA